MARQTKYWSVANPSQRSVNEALREGWQIFAITANGDHLTTIHFIWYESGEPTNG